MTELIEQDLREANRVLDAFINSNSIKSIQKAISVFSNSLKAGHKILSCGNGGSLCDATHFAEELAGRYRNDRNPYPAIAINDAAYITCVANDFSFDEIFSRYIEGVGEFGDVLLAISTSGNSSNVIKAAEMAKLKGMKVIGLTNDRENKLSEIADITIAGPASTFADRIQEIHIKVIHILIHGIENLLGPSDNS